MKIRILKDHHELSLQAAQLVIGQIREKPNAVLCLAAGETQVILYKMLSRLLPEQGIDFSEVHFVGLDEWVGIAPDNSGSCQSLLRKNLLTPLGIKETHIHFFDALATDLSGECRKMEALIKKLGGIDLMCVGIGMNGHIGFNEPGTSPALRCHVATLDHTTQTVGQKYFQENTQLISGITFGMAHLMEAQGVILMANQQKKAAIIKKALAGTVTEQVPASLIQNHPNAIILIDQEAASELVRN